MSITLIVQSGPSLCEVAIQVRGLHSTQIGF
jgi:hypothetical protein